jgi:hypothetical protein
MSMAACGGRPHTPWKVDRSSGVSDVVEVTVAEGSMGVIGPWI